MVPAKRSIARRALIWFNVVALGLFVLAVGLGGTDMWFLSLAILILGVPAWIAGNVVLGGLTLLRSLGRRMDPPEGSDR